MNKSWSILIIFGIIFLIVAVGWEILQVSSGVRSTIDTTVVEYTKDKLISKKLEDHLTSDPNFVSAKVEDTNSVNPDSVSNP
jgi:hypothetical protein